MNESKDVNWNKMKNLRRFLLLFTFVLFTGLIAATYEIWCTKPPITAAFQVEVEKPLTLEIKWAETETAPFRAEVGVFCKVTPADREVVVELPVSKVSRFRVDAGSYPGHMTLSNLQLKCGRDVVRFDDFSQFTYRNVQNHEIEPGKVSLYSQHKDPYMVYKQPLEIKRTSRVEWLILGGIIMLSAMLSFLVLKIVPSAFKLLKCSTLRSILGRCLFVLILTTGIVAATRGIWSSKPPIIVSFHVEVTKPVDLEIKWAESAETPFRADVGVFRKVTPANREVVVELPARKVSRFRVDAGSYPGKLTLSKLQLSSGDTVVQFNDFSQFAYYNIEDKSIEPGRLKLNSAHRDPYMEYQLPLELKKKRQYDLFALGIIIILAALMSSVLVNTVRYAMRGRSKMEWKNCLFCTLFCCLFIVPVLKMDKRDVLPEENRRMAGLPGIIQEKDGGINYGFGKQFESWLQDRFTGRSSFIKRYNEVKNFIDTRKENKMAIQYPNGWMFCKPWVGRIFRKPSPEELDEITSKLVRLKSECDSWGTRLYLLICPIKEDMYSRFHLTGRTSPFEVNTILEEHLRTQAPQLAVIYPRSRMQEMCLDDDKLLFYKTDTHQNMDGAYLINDALIKRIASDYPIPPPPPFDAFNIIQNRKVGVGRNFGNGFLMSSLQVTDETLLNTKWNYYELRNSSLLQAREDKERERYSKYENGKGVGVLLGDSFTENQAIWLQYSFNELYKWRANNAKENNEMRIERWRDKLSTIKPDVLVICVSASDSFFHLKNLYKD